MADESKLNIQITADASGIEAATAAATATIKELQEEVVRATNRMAEAQAAFGAAAAFGNQKAKDALASYVAEAAAAKAALDSAQAGAASGVGEPSYSSGDAEKLRASNAWNREMAAANKAEEARLAAGRAAELAALKADILTRSELELAGAEDTTSAATLRSSMAWNREMAAANMAAESEIAEARAAELAALQADILARSEVGLAESETVATRASYNHAEAMGAARVSMGAMSGSMGMMESGMARIIASSSIIGPALAAAVPVFMFAVGVAMVIQFGEAVYKAFDMGGEAARKSQEEISAVNDTLDHMNVQLAVTLDKELEAKAKSEGKPFNGLKLSADEAALAAANLEEKLDGVIKRELAAVKSMAGTTTQQFIGEKGGTKYEETMLGEHARRLDAAKDSQAALTESESYAASLQVRLIDLQKQRNEGSEFTKGVLRNEVDAVQTLIAMQEKEHAAIKATIDVQANEPVKGGGNKLAERGDKGELEAWKKTQDEKYKSEEAHIKNLRDLNSISLAEEVAQLEELGGRRRAMQTEYYDRAIKIAGMAPETRTNIPVLKAERGNIPAEGATETETLNASVVKQNKEHQEQIAAIKAQGAISQATEQLNADEKHAAALRSMHQASIAQTESEDLAAAQHETKIKLDANAADEAIAKANGDKGEVELTKLEVERAKILQDGLDKEQAIRDAAAIKEHDALVAKLKRDVEESKKAGDDRQSEAERYIRFNERMGNISPARAAKQEIAAVNKNESTQTAEVNKQEAGLGPDASKQGSAGYEQFQKLEEQKTAIARKAADERQRIAMQEAEREKQIYDRFFSSMQGPLNGFVDHWLTSGQRMGAAFQKMGDQMAMSIINDLLKMTEKWVAHELLITAAHAAGLATRKTQDGVSYALSNSELMAELGKWIAMEWAKVTHHAATTAANTTASVTGAAAQQAAAAAAAVAATISYTSVAAMAAASAVAGIPITGPMLAVAAASTMESMGMGFTIMAAFAKGGVVGGTAGYGQEIPILATPGERVLTTAQTQQFDKMTSGNSGSQQGGENHYHYSPNISGIDGASVAGMARQHGNTFMRQAARQSRLMGRSQG